MGLQGLVGVQLIVNQTSRALYGIPLAVNFTISR